MGGYGSGKYQTYNAKDTVEGNLVLNIFKLYREGWIQWNETKVGTFHAGDNWMSFRLQDNRLWLEYTFKHDNTHMLYPIQITSTTPQFGGRRLWFQCPRCDRRVGKLILAQDQVYYLCRTCANLTYQSTRELRGDRLLASFAARQKRRARIIAKYHNA